MFDVHPYLLILDESKVPSALKPRIRKDLKVQKGSNTVAVDLGTTLWNAQALLEDPQVESQLPEKLLIRDAGRRLTVVDFAGRSGSFWLNDSATRVDQPIQNA